MSPNTLLVVEAAIGPFTTVLFGWALSSGAIFKEKQGNSLYRVWYLFAVVACITILTLFIAQTEGFFASENGNDSRLGKYIILVIEIYLDLFTEIGIFLSITFVIVAPPSIAYVISGFYGFAK